jgi:hypothetical protein
MNFGATPLGGTMTEPTPLGGTMTERDPGDPAQRRTKPPIVRELGRPGSAGRVATSERQKHKLHRLREGRR